MTAIKPRNFATKAVAIIALAASAGALAQMGPRVPGDVSLVVDGGQQQLAITPLISETAASDLMTYDFQVDKVRFSAGKLASADYDDPLFCFDLGSPQSAVTIQAKDPNGHVIIDNFDLDVSLDYLLSTSILKLQPGIEQHCFFLSGTTFGLFGMESSGSSGDPDIIKNDRFEPDLSLSLEFQNVPGFVTAGEVVSYELVVTNTGTADLQRVALQELFPENMSVYDAGLSAGTWTCSPANDAVCPASAPGTGSLRAEEMNSGGIDMPPDGALTFHIQRTVDAASQVGEVIKLHAGTVSNSFLSDVPFAVDTAEMTVIGPSAGLSVSDASASADSYATTGVTSDDAQITVTVLDSSNNPVPDEPVFLDSPGGLTITSATSGTSDSNGEVKFTATAKDIGDYTISFTSGSYSGSGTVTILPGIPDTFYLHEAVSIAEADGIDEIEVQILVQDQYGNAVDSSLVEVSDDDGLTGLPPSEFTNIDGKAIFKASSDVVGVFEPTFSVAGVGTATATVEFEAGEPAGLEFTLPPPNPVIAGVPFDVALQVVDASGHPVSNDQATFVTLNFWPNGGQPQYIASDGVTNGEVTFTVTLGTSDIGVDHRLQAQGAGTGFFGVTSDRFDVESL